MANEDGDIPGTGGDMSSDSKDGAAPGTPPEAPKSPEPPFPQGGVTPPPPLRSKKATLLGNPRPPEAPKPVPAPSPAAALEDELVASLERTIAIDGNVNLGESPASVRLPSLDWGDDDTPAVSPNMDDDSPTLAREAPAVPADEDSEDDLEQTMLVDNESVEIEISVAGPESDLEATVAIASEVADFEATVAIPQDSDDEMPVAPPLPRPPSGDDESIAILDSSEVLSASGADLQQAMDEPAAAEEKEASMPGLVDISGAQEESVALWTGKPTAPMSDSPDSRLGWGKFFGVAALTAVAVVAGGVWLTRHNARIQPPPAPADVAPPPVAKPLLRKPAPAKKAAAAPSVLSKTAPSTTASAIATSTATTASAATAASAPTIEKAPVPPPPAAPGKDGSDLPSTMGYLQVTYSADPTAQVFFFARAVGAVGQQVAVPCARPAFIRVGKEPGPRWLSGGQTVKIKCQGSVAVTMKPR